MRPHRPVSRPTATAALATVAAVVLSLGTVAASPASAASAASPASAASAASAGKSRPTKVATRTVVFDLANTNDTDVACLPDNRAHQVRGRLVGPQKMVRGNARSSRINVLVHDAGTGAWFWNQRRYPAFDYATQLAQRGQTFLVLDRLGYDRSPLADGDDTCLGAQAHLLHQVVQKLYAGTYRFTGRGIGDPPHAGTVVVQGHGTGAAIAQIEAAEYDDTAGLVLMSWSGRNASADAVAEARRQSPVCARGATYAPFGASAMDFRRLLFASAPTRVQRSAVRLRNSTPCGDVTSLASAVSVTATSASKVEVPVLLMFGSADRRLRPGTARATARSFSNSRGVSLAVVRGAGSALPLERQAPRTRGTVLRWLKRL